MQKSGWVLLAVGGTSLLSMLALDLVAGRSWLLAGLCTAERLLPLFGLGLLIGQLPSPPESRLWPAAVLLLVAGALLGLVFREDVYLLVAPVPGAAANLFMMGPLACVLTGVALIPPRPARPWLAVPLIPVVGAAIAIATRLGDPTLYAPHYLPAALLAQLWFVAAIALPVGRFDPPWLSTGSRIVASWMIAIGLLYGGAYLAARDKSLTPPPFAVLQGEGAAAGIATVLPALDTTGGAP
ncbi:hypothetical protein [Rhizobium sp. SL42]|uniref:hypothetical protein n=1 Tax=Rhizobium sp. SL42 TaxID=2806346 RepID=UPI001F32D0C8|nr:hypothetical protein [Rhizobium sp. SL42]UJW76160.1 hypothetical protein IM739_06675 [Rhizobium sp. SL42]